MSLLSPEITYRIERAPGNHSLSRPKPVPYCLRPAVTEHHYKFAVATALRRFPLCLVGYSKQALMKGDCGHQSKMQNADVRRRFYHCIHRMTDHWTPSAEHLSSRIETTERRPTPIVTFLRFRVVYRCHDWLPYTYWLIDHSSNEHCPTKSGSGAMQFPSSVLGRCLIINEYASLRWWLESTLFCSVFLTTGWNRCHFTTTGIPYKRHCSSFAVNFVFGFSWSFDPVFGLWPEFIRSLCMQDESLYL